MSVYWAASLNKHHLVKKLLASCCHDCLMRFVATLRNFVEAHAPIHSDHKLKFMSIWQCSLAYDFEQINLSRAEQ
jgi:hypothetical protein